MSHSTFRTPVLDAAGITVTHPGASRPVLRDVSCRFFAGEAVAVTGPSGSGKTTLLHALAGLRVPQSGRVVFAPARHTRPFEVTALSGEQRSELRRTDFGLVFQSGQLIAELTAEENAALPLLLAGTDNRAALEQARRALASVGTGHLATHRPGEMSGGQQQRVAIARALVTGPSVLFADEPTGALDSATSREVLGVLLGATREAGATLVIVTHDPSVAAACDRVIDLGRQGVAV
jgi:putative ABC transport system ATP-binding protein